jgi:hypothetical protein
MTGREIIAKWASAKHYQCTVIQMCEYGEGWARYAALVNGTEVTLTVNFGTQWVQVSN